MNTNRGYALELVSPHFKLEEFAQPAGYGLPAEGYPLELVETCLRPLCSEVLEVVRAQVGRPVGVIVGGGWRGAEWQKRHRAARGNGVAEHSQHSAGTAADIAVAGMSGEELHDLVLQLWESRRLPALGGLGLYRGQRFTHVDVRPHQPGALARWP